MHLLLLLLLLLPMLLFSPTLKVTRKKLDAGQCLLDYQPFRKDRFVLHCTSCQVVNEVK
jgi:hypothetical protein